MTLPTLDTAIAAWKAARTQMDRNVAGEAIERHISAETPDYAACEAATWDLLEELKHECGPVVGG